MAPETCPYCQGPAHPSGVICLGRCTMCGEPVAAVGAISPEAADVVRHSVRRYRTRILHGGCGTVYRAFEADVVLLDVADAAAPPPPRVSDPGPV